MRIAALEALLLFVILLLEDIRRRDSHGLSALELDLFQDWLTNLKEGCFTPSSDVKLLNRERIL